MIIELDIANFVLLTTFLILVAAAINYKTIKESKALIVLISLSAISLLSDLIGSYLNSNGLYNIWLFNLYTILEFAMLVIFYLLLFPYSKKVKTFISIVVSLILIFLIWTTIKQSFTLHLNSALMGAESIVIIIGSIMYFKVMLDHVQYDTPLANPFFWINSAILIYFSGSFFIFIFSEYRGAAVKLNLWDIHNIIHIIYNMLIFIGIWKTRRT